MFGANITLAQSFWCRIAHDREILSARRFKAIAKRCINTGNCRSLDACGLAESCHHEHLAAIALGIAFAVMVQAGGPEMSAVRSNRAASTVERLDLRHTICADPHTGCGVRAEERNSVSIAKTKTD